MWYACCECGWCATFSYAENAYVELARHVIKTHGTINFKIVILSETET